MVTRSLAIQVQGSVHVVKNLESRRTSLRSLSYQAAFNIHSVAVLVMN